MFQEEHFHWTFHQHFHVEIHPFDKFQVFVTFSEVKPVTRAGNIPCQVLRDRPVAFSKIRMPFLACRCVFLVQRVFKAISDRQVKSHMP
jgi:hypothetical protein